MQDQIITLLNSSARVKAAMAEDHALVTQIKGAARQFKNTIKQNGTIYLCGNGGSACDAMHFSEELVARFKRDRRGIKAVHFLDPSIITCWANDYDFNSVFERCAETFCEEKDTLVVFSTSGNSENIIRAARAARDKKCYVIALTGKAGGKLASIADLPIIVPSAETERIQEAHITLVHIFLELIESTK